MAYIHLAIIPALLFIIFIISYSTEQRSMRNGMLFNLFVLSLGFVSFLVSFTSDNMILRVAIVFPILIGIVLIPFVFVALIVGLFLNARILLKREGKRLANSLTLLLGLAILSYLVFLSFNLTTKVPLAFVPILAALSLTILYFFVNASNFLSAYFLYQFNHPKRNQQFIIVLGSGLINDQVPPLLASRIERAITFYEQQKKVATPPTIIFSGGQGPNEGLSEAEAMQRYATARGIPEEHTIQENQSVNTYENLVFSKKIMDTRMPEGYNSIFTTNNFHLFRAAIYAKQAGLASQGIGAKTALYYWPNAMIREYIALVVMFKKRHVLVIGTLFAVAILTSLLLLIAPILYN